MLKKIGPFLLFSLFLTLSSPALANTPYFSAFDWWPVSGSQDYLSLPSSHVLRAKQFHLGIDNTFAWKPLKTVSGNDFIKYYAIHFATLSVGLGHRVAMSATLPVISMNRFLDSTLTTPGTKSEIGDGRISLRYSLLDLEEHPLGLGVEGFLTLPSGKETDFMGENKITGGGRLLLDLKPTSNVTWTVSVGSEWREKVLFRSDFNFKERLLLGTGLGLSLKEKWRLLVEMTSATPWRNPFSKKNGLPIEVVGGF